MQSLRKDFDQDETGTRGYYEWMSQNSARKAGLAPCHVPLSRPCSPELSAGLCGNHPIAVRARLGLAKWMEAGLLYFSPKAQAA